MASKNHVDGNNPYHYSFSLCAENNPGKASNNHDHNRRTFNRGRGSNKFNISRGRAAQDSCYSKYLGEVSEYKFYCDRCDRSFRNDEDLQKHIGEHVTCGKNGCQFTAHPKIIDLHFRMQHKTGIFQKLKKLDSPEEVKKWLEERKRKYPTTKTVENKTKLEEAKEKRGENVKPDTSRFNPDFSRRGRRDNKSLGRQQKRARKPRDDTETYKLKVAAYYKQREDEIAKQNGVIPSFKGLGACTEAEESEMANNPEDALVTDEDEPVQTGKTEEIVNKSLALLMGYNSDMSEEDGETPTAKPAIATVPTTNDNNDAPEEIKNVKLPDIPIEPKEERKRKLPEKSQGDPKRPRHRHSNQPEPVQRRRKPTLLQRLLHKDIEQEKRVILECVHHVVKSKFFAPSEESVSEGAVTINHGRKQTLLRKLLKDEIVKERNIILQCIRHIVKANFFEPVTSSIK